MDEDLNFNSGNQSGDDAGGTPVQDKSVKKIPDRNMSAELRDLDSDSEKDNNETRTDADKPVKRKKADSEDKGAKPSLKKMRVVSGSDGEKEEEEEVEVEQVEGVAKRGSKDTRFKSDFDLIMARKKAQSGRKRRKNRDGGTLLSNADDVVSAMITKMNEAAKEDMILNGQREPAVKKIGMLWSVVMQLKRRDMKNTFVDSGGVSAIKEWISPLPDKSLPPLQIREQLLRILQELPNVGKETLKDSGIGRAVLFLYKHPKELRSNKALAWRLINDWSRLIWNIPSDYTAMTREERQQMDLDRMPQKRSSSDCSSSPGRDLEKQLSGEEDVTTQGDTAGFSARTRMPMPSNKVYVVRPKWKVEVESVHTGPVKKEVSRVNKLISRLAHKRRMGLKCHAVNISVDGRHMPL